jgi:hypothetical protein
MASLMNGLAAFGQGVAQFAGSAGLELQKSQLAEQQATLADQLATTRETKLQGQAQTFQAAQQASAQQFQTGLEGQRQTFQAGQQESAQRFQTGMQGSQQKFQAGQTDKELAVRTSEGKATRDAEAARQQAVLNADSPEIKSAKQFQALTPEQKQAYREELGTKAGLPAWMVSGAGGGSDTGPTTSGDPGAPAVTGTPDPGVSNRNDKALDGLPPAAISIVKAMVDGRMTPPTSMALGKPSWQVYLAKAAEYDPTFDQTTWAGRVATKKDFASGKSAQAVTALNTALGHAGVVDEAMTALNNGSIPGINWFENKALSAFGSARPTNAKMAVDALASEARKVFAGSAGGNLSELQEWQKNFPIDGSLDQQKGAMKQFTNLLDSRLEALSDQYNRGMGRTDDPINLLQPHAREVYERLTGREPSNATGYQLGQAPDAAAKTAPTPAPSAAIPSWVKPGDQYSPSRGQARGADGKTYGPQ